MTKIALASLNAADEAGFMAALGDVYEHAPRLPLYKRR